MFESVTQVLGCKASDAVGAVAPQTLSVAPAFPRRPHEEVQEDTVDYEPSQEALALADQINNGVYSTSTLFNVNTFRI